MIKGSEQSPFPYYRDFSDTFTVIFDFVRDHFKPLSKVLFIVLIPLSIFEGFLSFYLQDVIGGLMGGVAMDGGEGVLFTTYIVLLFSLHIVNAAFTTQYCFSVHINGKAPDSLSGQIKSSILLIPKFTVITILSFIVSTVAALFCLIPFFYVFVPLNLVFAIRLFETTNAVQTIDKSVVLVRGYWWSTFGIFILLIIMSTILSNIFFLPEIIMELSKLFDTPESYEVVDTTMDSSEKIIYLPFYILSTIVDNLFASVIFIAGVFRYFSLSIAQNGMGLQMEINSLGSELKQANEETY